MCHPSSISSLLHLTCANGDIDVEHKGSERQHAHTLARSHARLNACLTMK